MSKKDLINVKQNSDRFQNITKPFIFCRIISTAKWLQLTYKFPVRIEIGGTDFVFSVAIFPDKFERF